MEEIIAFNRGVPPAESFPKEQLAESARRVILKEGDQILQYGSAMGYLPLREYIAAQFGVNPEQVIIGQGSLQLLDTYIKTSLQPGDDVFVEQPVYDRVLTLFKRGGINLSGFMLHNGSVSPEEIESSLRKGNIPKALYVIPDFQNPSGAEMPLETRKKLVSFARQYNFLLIEDSAYRRLRYDGQELPRLYDLDPEHVLHMSSFGKIISPGIRVGYMIGRKDIISTLSNYAENTYINTSYINQAIIIDFIQQGWINKHVDFLKTLYSERLEKALESLAHHMSGLATWLTPKGGFFIGLFLINGKSQPAAQTLKENGLMLVDGEQFFINGGRDFIRLPFASTTPEQIELGVKKLAALM